MVQIFITLIYLNECKIFETKYILLSNKYLLRSDSKQNFENMLKFERCASRYWFEDKIFKNLLTHRNAQGDKLKAANEYFIGLSLKIQSQIR